MMSLSVIIVAYGNYDILAECLKSIIKFNDIDKNLEIIVSDNSETADLAEQVKLNFPSVVILRNFDNPGFGEGNNRAVQVSSGKYLLFLNPDTLLIEPIFSFAIDKFEQNDNLGVFGMQLLFPNRSRAHSFFLMDNYKVGAVMLFKLFSFFGCFIDRYMFTSGADLFVRRDLFEAVGGFDKNIFMYYEEPDLVKRINNIKGTSRSAFFKSKKIIHLEGGNIVTTNKSKIKQIRNSLDSYLYYCKKWNISFENNVRSMRRYQIIKKYIYTVLLNKEKKSVTIEMIDVFSQYLDKFS